MLKKVVQKFIDQNTGLPYWYNPRTGVTTWHKPALLGHDDVDSAVAVAEADVEYVVSARNSVDAVVSLASTDTSRSVATATTLLRFACAISAMISTASLVGHPYTSVGNRQRTGDLCWTYAVTASIRYGNAREFNL